MKLIRSDIEPTIQMVNAAQVRWDISGWNSPKIWRDMCAVAPKVEIDDAMAKRASAAYSWAWHTTDGHSFKTSIFTVAMKAALEAALNCDEG